MRAVYASENSWGDFDGLVPVEIDLRARSARSYGIDDSLRVSGITLETEAVVPVDWRFFCIALLWRLGARPNLKIQLMILKMSKYLNYLSKVAFVVCFTFPSELSGEEETSGYMFQGLNINARSGNSYFPVVTVDKRKIHIDVGDKMKKLSLETFCLGQKNMSVSGQLLEVLELDVLTTSTTDLHREADVASDMHRAEGQSETEAAIMSAKGAERGSIQAVKDSNAEMQSSMREGLESKMFEGSGHADIVYVDLEFLPNADIEGAYCVFALNYVAVNVDTGKPIGRRLVARVKYLGNLRKDKLFKMKKRFAMNEFSLGDSEYSLHVFSGEGKEIAMSISRGLKKLSEAEMEQIRAAMLEGSRSG